MIIEEEQKQYRLSTMQPFCVYSFVDVKRSTEGVMFIDIEGNQYSAVNRVHNFKVDKRELEPSKLLFTFDEMEPAHKMKLMRVGAFDKVILNKYLAIQTTPFNLISIEGIQVPDFYSVFVATDGTVYGSELHIQVDEENNIAHRGDRQQTIYEMGKLSTDSEFYDVEAGAFRPSFINKSCKESYNSVTQYEVNKLVSMQVGDSIFIRTGMRKPFFENLGKCLGNGTCFKATLNSDVMPKLKVTRVS